MSAAELTSFNKLLNSEYILSPWQQFKSTPLLPKFISQQLWELLQSNPKRNYKEETELIRDIIPFAYSGWTYLSLVLNLQVVLRVVCKQK